MRRSVSVLLACVGLMFVMTRSLTHHEVYFLALDDPIYFALADALPHYSAYGGIGFVNHPPLFPMLIRIAATVLPMPIAGLFVATAAQALTALGLWSLARRLGLGAVAAGTALALVVLNGQWYRLAGMTYKETTYACLVLGLLAAWLAAVHRPGAMLVLACVLGAAVAAENDHVIFAVPGCFIAAVVYARTVKQWRWSLLTPAIVTGIVYAIWIGRRFLIYRAAPEAAVGLGGLIEPTQNISLRVLLTPQAFPYSAALTGVSSSWPTSTELRMLAESLWVFAPVLWLRDGGFGIPAGGMLVGLAGAVVGVAWLVYVAVRAEEASHRGAARAVLILLAFLCIPGSQTIVRQRLRMFLILPGLTALGTAGALRAVGRLLHVTPSFGAIAVSIGTVAMSLVAPLCLHYVVWFRNAPVEAQIVADWLTQREPGAIMSQVGYSQEFAWITDRTVYGLPTDAVLLNGQVERYRIRYLIYGTHYWQSPDDTTGRRPVWNGETIEAIRADPAHFPLAAKLEDVYVPPRRGLTGDTYWIHAVEMFDGDGETP